MAKKDKTNVDIVSETENVVTIHVNVNGRVITKSITIKTDGEIEEKVRRITRNVKFFGGILVRVLMNGKSADEIIFKRIEKILNKN